VDLTRLPLPQNVGGSIGDDDCRCVGSGAMGREGMQSIARKVGRPEIASPASTMLGQERAQLSRRQDAGDDLVSRELLGLKALLDHMPQASLLVTSDAHLLSANRPAEALLRQGQLFASKRGLLEVKGPQQEELKAAITQAAGALDPVTSTLLIAPSPGDARVVIVLPIGPHQAAPCALLMVQDLIPEGSDALLRRLGQLFGLTAAEAAVAALVAEGLTPHEIATRRVVAIATVRTQLRVIAAKLHCNRLPVVAAIVRGVAGLPGD
jgi:DNA-binding CsgD family transcriptional regulator